MEKEKSLLMIETPHNCSECKLCGSISCIITEDAFTHIDPNTEVLSSCPLRPLPLEKLYNYYEFKTYTGGFNKGYNFCRQDIINSFKTKEEKKNGEISGIQGEGSSIPEDSQGCDS